jgi:predicted RecA/RadA family phage recombinase
MAQTYQCVLLGEGGFVPYTPGSATAAGDVVITNGMFQFATQPIAASVAGTLKAAGKGPSIRIVKVNGAISVGNAIYWDADGDPQGGTAGTGGATTTATANTFIGRCIVAAGATDETVDAEMSIGVVTAGTLENAIADPGDAAAIPVTVSGYVPLVTAGAETRTLAAPASIGLQLLLYMKTDVGDCVVTCATTVNETGNNTLTFDNTGEVIYLIAVEEGANIRWRAVGNDGVGLTTV